MSLCSVTGFQCCCQPDEGIPCPYEKPHALRDLMLEWREAAIKAQKELADRVSHDHPPPVDQHAGGEALTDAALLDWIEQNHVGIECGLEGEFCVVRYRRYGAPIRGEECVSLRSAIERAIRQKGGAA